MTTIWKANLVLSNGTKLGHADVKYDALNGIFFTAGCFLVTQKCLPVSVPTGIWFPCEPVRQVVSNEKYVELIRIRCIYILVYVM